MKLEIAVVSADGARIAAEEGADRVELCNSLEIGGITPTQGLMDMASEAADGRLEIHALIRCRPGDFRYTPAEVDTMVREVRHLTAQGAAGIVLGALNIGGDIDIESTRRIADAAKEGNPFAQLTFHRAFDQTPDTPAAIDTLLDLGFNRVLSSGRSAIAGQGTRTLQRMVVQAAGGLEIMAGGGLTVDNIPAMRRCGIPAVHLSAKRIVSTLQSETISLGSADAGDPTAYLVTDRAVVKAARTATQ